ncbi:UNVERIFIED_CONTAM: hypothetical protein Sradi_2639200 [Sesamum radiatum]|uniref:Uncharacterized protein n=1 Tax=Sesamum radiatum TaxID=300843 RepID=A0AAW2S635_SESRA
MEKPLEELTGELPVSYPLGRRARMSPSTSSSGASTSNGVATRARTSVTICSRIVVKTICWMAPNRTGGNSSIEVSEEVLRRGASVTRPTTLEESS